MRERIPQKKISEHKEECKMCERNVKWKIIDFYSVAVAFNSSQQ